MCPSSLSVSGRLDDQTLTDLLVHQPVAVTAFERLCSSVFPEMSGEFVTPCKAPLTALPWTPVGLLSCKMTNIQRIRIVTVSSQQIQPCNRDLQPVAHHLILSHQTISVSQPKLSAYLLTAMLHNEVILRQTGSATVHQRENQSCTSGLSELWNAAVWLLLG